MSPKPHKKIYPPLSNTPFYPHFKSYSHNVQKTGLMLADRLVATLFGMVSMAIHEASNSAGDSGGFSQSGLWRNEHNAVC